MAKAMADVSASDVEEAVCLGVDTEFLELLGAVRAARGMARFALEFGIFDNVQGLSMPMVLQMLEETEADIQEQVNTLKAFLKEPERMLADLKEQMDLAKPKRGLFTEEEVRDFKKGRTIGTLGNGMAHLHKRFSALAIEYDKSSAGYDNPTDTGAPAFLAIGGITLGVLGALGKLWQFGNALNNAQQDAQQQQILRQRFATIEDVRAPGLPREQGRVQLSFTLDTVGHEAVRWMQFFFQDVMSLRASIVDGVKLIAATGVMTYSYFAYASQSPLKWAAEFWKYTIQAMPVRNEVVQAFKDGLGSPQAERMIELYAKNVKANLLRDGPRIDGVPRANVFKKYINVSYPDDIGRSISAETRAARQLEVVNDLLFGRLEKYQNANLTFSNDFMVVADLDGALSQVTRTLQNDASGQMEELYNVLKNVVSDPNNLRAIDGGTFALQQEARNSTLISIPAIKQLLDANAIPNPEPSSALTPAEVSASTVQLGSLAVVAALYVFASYGAKSQIGRRVLINYYKTENGRLDNEIDRLLQCCAKMSQLAFFATDCGQPAVIAVRDTNPNQTLQPPVAAHKTTIKNNFVQLKTYINNRKADVRSHPEDLTGNYTVMQLLRTKHAQVADAVRKNWNTLAQDGNAIADSTDVEAYCEDGELFPQLKPNLVVPARDVIFPRDSAWWKFMNRPGERQRANKSPPRTRAGTGATTNPTLSLASVTITTLPRPRSVVDEVFAKRKNGGL